MGNDLLDAVRKGAKATRRTIRPRTSRNALAEFITAHIRTDKGPHSWSGYRPLREICIELTDDVPSVDVLKPVQVGVTTSLGFGYPLWQGYEQRRHGMYYLPTDKMVRDVMKSRFPEAIRGSDIARDVRNTESDGLILVGPEQRRIVWAGMREVRNVRQWPADYCVYDEVDDLNQENLLVAKGRLAASSYAHEVAFACGHYPGEGIHGRYLLGDQRQWVVSCTACRTDHVLADEFPGCIQRATGRNAGSPEWRRVCVKCGAPVNEGRDGRFVALRPGVQGRRSYRVSALDFGATHLGRLMADYADALADRRKLAVFRSERLAAPDAGDRAALTAEIVSRATRPRDGAIAVPPRYIGIDVGDMCHAALAGVSGDEVAYVGFARMRGEDVLGWLAAQDAAYRFDAVVIDQKPEGSLAREVCRRYPGRAWMQEFRRGAEAEDAKTLEGEQFPKLSMERELVIENFCDRVKAAAEGKPGATFPETWDGVPYAQSAPARHIVTGSQREEKTDANGIPVLRFRSGRVENHWLMACVFAHAASQRIGSRGISEIRVSGGTLRTSEIGIRERVGSRIKELFS
jgi:hypothetical protein